MLFQYVFIQKQQRLKWLKNEPVANKIMNLCSTQFVKLNSVSSSP